VLFPLTHTGKGFVLERIRQKAFCYFIGWHVRIISYITIFFFFRGVELKIFLKKIIKL